MKIAVASNHVGFDAKTRLLAQMKDFNHEALDFGPSSDEMCDYPDYAAKAASAVSKAEIDRAILIGGTGIGMSIVANKFPGVRAALCHDIVSAQLSRRQNDANILCLSTHVLSDEASLSMIKLWLTTPFEGGRYDRRNAKIAEHERSIHERRVTNKAVKRPI